MVIIKSLCWVILLQLCIGAQSEELDNKYQHTIQSAMENLHDGISGISYDQAGNPMVNVNGSKLSSLLMEHDKHYRRMRRSTFPKPYKLWPNGVVHYVFDRTVDDTAKKAILLAMKMVTERVPCIKYIPATNADLKHGYVLFTGKGPKGACCSAPGGYFPNGPNTVNLHSGCTKMSKAPSISKDGVPGTVIHELMHSLGVAHEHNRPDRDDYIEVNFANIIPHEKYAFYKIDSPVDDVVEGEYDYRSIMHYAQIGSLRPDLNWQHEENYSMRKKPPHKGYLEYTRVMSKADYTGLRNRYGCPGVLPSDAAYLAAIDWDWQVQVKLAKIRRQFKRLEREATKGMTDAQKEERRLIRRKQGEYWEALNAASASGDWRLAAKIRRDFAATGTEKVMDKINEGMEVVEKTYKPPVIFEEEGDRPVIYQKTPQKMTPQKTIPQKITPQKMTPQKITLQKTIPQKMTPQKMTPQKMTPQKKIPQQIIPQKMTPRKMTLQKFTPQKKTVQKMTLQKSTPQKMTPQKMIEKKKAMSEKEEEMTQNKVQTRDDLLETSNCVVTQWSRWSTCKKGRIARLRKIKQEAWKPACSNVGIQMFVKDC